MRALLAAFLLMTACKGSAEESAESAEGETLLSPQQMEKLQIATEKIEEREVGGELAASGGIAPGPTPDKVYVYTDLRAADLPKVAVGAPVSVSVAAFPARRFEGSVDWVSGALDPTTRTARLRCTVANVDRALRPDMYATVSISVPKQRALALPRQALLRRDGETVVAAVLGQNKKGQTRLARRAVKVDESVPGDYLPVAQGLREGDVVVVRGGAALK
jgi:multidrug efflux pump subunit AcrA (membrane-fusion protein)